MTTTTTLPPHRVTPARVLRAEWHKLWTLRSTWITLVATTPLTAAMGAGLGAAYDGTGEGGMDGVVFALLGTQFATVNLGILGVLATAGEYSTGQIRAKDAQPEELLAGVRAVATGDAVVAPSLTRRLLDAYVHHLPTDPGTGDAAEEDPRLTTLTDREREILTVIGKGRTNTEIASRLHLAESTVKTHVGRILAKTGSHDRIQAVILAYDAKLVEPS
ncbi:response regulator transcription factor [Streptomyces sp. NPDC058735]|uniref:response regulator transcription factor n=1 Tax=unclassified Streptomyces TaxID=2593676 RepID=UPI00369CA16D